MKRLNRLITDVSNASRLDAELARQKMSPLDVTVVLRNVVGIFRDLQSAGEPCVALRIPPADDERDFFVDGHEGRLAQVITNMVDNALSFSPPGGVVTLSAERSGPCVRIVVADGGPGIPEDRLEAIFDRFYSDRPETDQKRGKNSGLGLSISREIVQAHQGRIWAENIYAGADSAAGGVGPVSKAAPRPVGARFIVELPAAVARTGGAGVRRV